MDNEARANTTLNARLFLRAMFKEETISPNPKIIVRKVEMCRNSSGNSLCKTCIRAGSLGLATDHRLMTPLPNVMTVADQTTMFWIVLRDASILRLASRCIFILVPPRFQASRT